MSYEITRSLRYAMSIGYIGEDALVPTMINQAVRKVMGLPPRPVIHIYYCGELNDELRERFGYTPKPDEATYMPYLGG